MAGISTISHTGNMIGSSEINCSSRMTCRSYYRHELSLISVIIDRMTDDKFAQRVHIEIAGGSEGYARVHCSEGVIRITIINYLVLIIILTKLLLHPRYPNPKNPQLLHTTNVHKCQQGKTLFQSLMEPPPTSSCERIHVPLTSIRTRDVYCHWSKSLFGSRRITTLVIL